MKETLNSEKIASWYCEEVLGVQFYCVVSTYKNGDLCVLTENSKENDSGITITLEDMKKVDGIVDIKYLGNREYEKISIDN